MLRAFKRLLTPDPALYQVFDAYGAIVAQSRNPVFYEQWEVSDTVDGRFDAIVLHVCLVVLRLERERSEATVEFTRQLCEAFFADMDRSLREMGATDTGVGKRVKKMAQAYYGRLKAYEEAQEHDAALITALQRNLYREQPVSQASLEAVAAYMRRNAQGLRTQSVEAILQGRLVFLN